MGAVYKCTHVELNQARAIKLLLTDSVNSDPNKRLRLRREAITACRFDHPNVVRIYDSGTNIVPIEGESTTEYYDELYIVMELLEGQTLKDYLKNNKPVSLNQAVSIAIQIADGLAEVHAQRVIYRDLKPANIMLTRDRHGNLLVKIVDFGAVKLMNHPLGLYEVDITGAMFIGSASYASPENCKNDPLDERSDIYNLGLILYEMLAGHPPFETSDWVDLLNKHAHALVPPLKDIPKSLAHLVSRSLEKDPNARPQSASEFASTLRDFERSVESLSGVIPNTTPLAVSSVITRLNSGSNGIEEDRCENEETRVAVGVAARSKEHNASVRVNEVIPSKEASSGIKHPESTVGQGKAIKKVKGADGLTYLPRPTTSVEPHPLVGSSQEKKANPRQANAKVPDPTKDKIGTTVRTVIAGITIFISLAASIFLIWRLGTKPLPISETVETSNTTVAPPVAPKFISKVGDELVTTTDVNIRIRPGGKAPWVGLAENGSRVRVLEKHNNWRKIIVLEHGREKEDPNSEDQGWIDGDNLKSIDGGT